jgi:uncharacterized membrane protein YeaQ/YmgE (transglycosylase-associated protein family)
MVLLTYTLVMSDLAVEVLVGALFGIVIGRVMSGGFGIVGDALLGIVGAVALAFLITYFNLFNISQYGLGGTIGVALIGSIVLTALVHLVTGRRASTVLGS